MVEGLDYGTFKQAQRWVMDELRMAPNVRVFQNGNIDFESITLNNYLIMKLELEQQIPKKEKHDEEDNDACPDYTTAIDSMEALTAGRNLVTDTETPLDDEDDMTLEVELARLEELKEKLIKKAKRTRVEKEAKAITQKITKEIKWKELTPAPVEAKPKPKPKPKAKAKAKTEAKAKQTAATRKNNKSILASMLNS